MYKYIAGICCGVIFVAFLLGIVLPLVVSTNQVPVYVIVVSVPLMLSLGVGGVYFIFNYLTRRGKKKCRKKK